MPIGLLAGLPAGQIEAILLHELAHVRRYDYLANVVQQLMATLLFYHPAVWWVSGLLSAERENCCDDVVVEMRGNVHGYAAALVTMEKNRWSGREPAVAATGGSLVKRIRRLLYPKGANGLWTPLFATLILIASAMVGWAAWPREQPRQGGATTEPQAEAALAPGIVKLKAFPDAPLAHFRLTADSRTAFETLARLADLNVKFTSDFQARPITVDLTNVKIEEAFRVVSDQTGSFWKPVASNTILVIPNNEINRREYGDHTEQSSFHKWLNEEVVYIITDEERAAFQKLTTDEERDMFVQQFWERRNPNPGSPENEFKKEHYRRIAYADEHFASARPGWKTDRGHMYIIYGPPDEIDSHPANIPYPFEVWTYRHLKGVGDNVPFTFIDQTGRGDYHLATPPWRWPVKKNSSSG